MDHCFSIQVLGLLVTLHICNCMHRPGIYLKRISFLLWNILSRSTDINFCQYDWLKEWSIIIHVIDFHISFKLVFVLHWYLSYYYVSELYFISLSLLPPTHMHQKSINSVAGLVISCVKVAVKMQTTSGAGYWTRL